MRKVALAALVFVVLATGIAGGAPVKAPVQSGIPVRAARMATEVLRFSAVGDVGASRQAAAVLDRVPPSGAFHLALGDLSYDEVRERRWCRFVKARVGRTYPFQLVAGNHEAHGRDGRIGRFASCLPNRLPGMTGRYGRQWFVDVPARSPVARIVMISPGLTFPRSTWRYAEGSSRYRWTARAIRSARKAGIPWVVVGMHMPCLSMGRYGCGSGSDIMNLLVRKRVDLVLSGHEHIYQRTKQIRTGPGCRRVPTRRYDPDCVASAEPVLRAGSGTVFITVGTGGTHLRDVRLSDRHTRYFSAWSGRNVSPSHGLLVVEATRHRLTAQFVPSGGAGFRDTVTMRH